MLLVQHSRLLQAVNEENEGLWEDFVQQAHSRARLSNYGHDKTQNDNGIQVVEEGDHLWEVACKVCTYNLSFHVKIFDAWITISLDSKRLPFSRLCPALFIRLCHIPLESPPLPMDHFLAEFSLKLPQVARRIL